MNDTRTIADRVKDIIATEACVDEAEVTPNASLVDDLGMDSLDLVEMAMALEEEFFDAEAISEDEAEKWKTVEDVIVYVERSASSKEPRKRR